MVCVFSVFRKLISLPIEDMDSVKCTMHCLLKEDLLLQSGQSNDSSQEIVSNTTSILQDCLHTCVEESLMRDIQWDEGLHTYTLRSLQNTTNATSSSNDFTASYPFTTLLSKLSSSMFANISFGVIQQLLKNSLNTLQYIIGDCLEVFPNSTPTLAIMPIYQQKANKLFDDVIKVWYRSLHQSTSTSLLCHEVVAIFNYVNQFGGLIDTYGTATSTEEKNRAIEKWKVKKVELFKLSMSALSHECKHILSKLYFSIDKNRFLANASQKGMPFLTTGPLYSWDLVQNVEIYNAIVRNCEDSASSSFISSSTTNTASSGMGYSSYSTAGNSSNNANSPDYPCYQWSEGLVKYWKETLIVPLLMVNQGNNSDGDNGSSTKAYFYNNNMAATTPNTSANSNNYVVPQDIRYPLLLQFLDYIKGKLFCTLFVCVPQFYSPPSLELFE